MAYFYWFSYFYKILLWITAKTVWGKWCSRKFLRWSFTVSSTVNRTELLLSQSDPSEQKNRDPTHNFSSVQFSRSVVSDSVRPQRKKPNRPPHPWDSPGKNTGVGCHFLLQCMKVKSESEVVQSCPTPSDPMDCSPPGSSVHGIFQARVLEWGAIAFSVVVSSRGQKDLA